jgi:Fe-S cluster biogenesis protein NfuA
VQLQGACSGCPSSTMTLQTGIKNILQRMLPTLVDDVVAA